MTIYVLKLLELLESLEYNSVQRFRPQNNINRSQVQRQAEVDRSGITRTTDVLNKLISLEGDPSATTRIKSDRIQTRWIERFETGNVDSKELVLFQIEKHQLKLIQIKVHQFIQTPLSYFRLINTYCTFEFIPVVVLAYTLKNTLYMTLQLFSFYQTKQNSSQLIFGLSIVLYVAKAIL